MLVRCKRIAAGAASRSMEPMLMHLSAGLASLYAVKIAETHEWQHIHKAPIYISVHATIGFTVEWLFHLRFLV